EKLLPAQRERILDEAADLELPLVERDVRLLAEIEDGPVLHFVLPDRQPGHAVTIPRPAALRREPFELYVDRAPVERDLPLNVFLSPRDEVVFSHHDILRRPR